MKTASLILLAFVCLTSEAKANSVCEFVLQLLDFSKSPREVGEQSADLVIESAANLRADRRDALPSNMPNSIRNIVSLRRANESVIVPEYNGYQYDGDSEITLNLELPRGRTLWSVLTKFERETMISKLATALGNGDYAHDRAHVDDSSSIFFEQNYQYHLSPRLGLDAACNRLYVGVCRDVVGIFSGLMIELGASPTDALLSAPIGSNHILNQIRFDLEASHIPIDMTPARRILSWEDIKKKGSRMKSQFSFENLTYAISIPADDVARLPSEVRAWPTNRRSERAKLFQNENPE